MYLVFILLFIIPLTTNANDNDFCETTQTVMAAAKISGACGVFVQMRDFQEKTKLDGGEEFISRFLWAESARLGQTVDQFINNCNYATEFYSKIYNTCDN